MASAIAGRSVTSNAEWLVYHLISMPLAPVEEGGVRIVEGTPQEPLMRRAQDATLVIEACVSAHVRKALLYSEKLRPEFFDLSSGQAGKVLEKFRMASVRRSDGGGVRRESRGILQ